MKKNEMFSERDTLEEAYAYATAVALSLDKTDTIPVLTAINVLANTSISMLERLEATATKLLDEVVEAPPTTYGEYTSSVASENVLLRDKIDKLVRQVEKQSDLRFILFTLEHTLDRSPS